LEQFKATSNYEDKGTVDYLLQNSHYLFTVEDGDTPLAIMGVILPTYLSVRGLIWFGPMKDAKFTHRMILEGKSLGEVFFDRLNLNLYAELDPARPDTIKFAKFFGMKYYAYACGVDLYERAR
jgi:hypothetical protein